MITLTKKEIKVLISLIDMFQFDGAKWGIDDIWLDNLKKKLTAQVKKARRQYVSIF